MCGMKVAWLIPVRDCARWLGEAVGSALAECGPDDEVVVVDDGSRDHPERVLPDDGRVRLLTQPPLGIVAALERGRAATDAPLIARLDSDDIALPGRIAAQRAMLDADPALLVVGGRARPAASGEGGLPEGMRRYVAWVNGLVDLRREILVESPLFHPSVLMRAAAVEAVGGYRHGDFPEDYDLWLRLAERGRLGAVAREVVVWRDRPGRLTRTDPRYRRGAFLGLKQDWVARTLLSGRPRVVVWGGGQAGTPWVRWLVRRGVDVVAVLDLKPGTTRQGVPLLNPDRLPELAFDLLLVAVGARGARDEIRGRIATMRPDLVEGRDWWAVA